jgi:CRP-like cAMP-binding protein
MSTEEAGLVPPAPIIGAEALAKVPMFAPLSEVERSQVLSIAKPVLFAAGESIVRQGDAGRSLFAIVRGEAAVTVAGTEGEVARLRAGDVLGEMSLLTGEARNATVTAATDCELFEIDAEGFRGVVLANPGMLETITSVTASRQGELDRHREANTAAASAADTRQSLLNRVRQFLRL